MAHFFHLAMLQVRDLGFSSTDNITCARPEPHLVGEKIVGSLTIHHLMILISAPCLAITVVSSLFLSWRHLHSYTAPNEQRQLLRMVNLPVAYCLFNFLALSFYPDYLYIEPISGVYEAFVVAALFFLVLEYVCPDGTDREKYFENLPGKDKKGNPIPGGSLNWFQKTWAITLQYPLTKTVFVVIQIITQYAGVYCENSMSPKYAHLWLFLADMLFIGGAFGATIQFFRRLINEIDPVHKSRAKVMSFVGIMIFQLLQGLIFGLFNGKLFSPSPKITYNDINFGIPSFLTCIECIIFSLIFQWSFAAAEYKPGNRLDRHGMNMPAARTKTWRAILDALNPMDIIAGTLVAIRLLFGQVQSRYGSSSGGGAGMPQRMKDGYGVAVGMEPLSSDRRSRMRGYSGNSDFDAEYTPPLDTTGYEEGMYPPPMQRMARDPSPSGQAGRWRSDGMRPQQQYTEAGVLTEYEPLTRSRDPSLSGVPAREPNSMV